MVDPARIRSPQDKPLVERCVPYARSTFVAEERFRDLEDCRERAQRWCRETAGMRIHGTTRLRPAEVFATDEAPQLKPLPDTAFDIPTWVNPKVAPDRHDQISQALYSIPGDLVGQRLSARVDSQTVKLYFRGELIKVHPRVGAGRRQTDPANLPSELTAYAMQKKAMIRAAWRDIRSVEQRLQRGTELLAHGQDPRTGGWLDPANLLWSLDHEIDSGAEILAHLPTAAQWPADLEALVPAGVSRRRWTRVLVQVLSGMLYPTNLDLHGFRVLLMAASGHTSEEISGLSEHDVEFTPEGVTLTFTKLRARSTRRRSYRTVQAKEPVAFGTESKLDVAELIRRLLAVTERVRRRSGLSPAPLFLRVNMNIYLLEPRPFEGP
ncbi:Mu transposase domain-containing protein [Nocardia gipuzkoensis]|uniref:Mu transposase domain-containing protein n=1 Tax=Nocardia gipuzkoensis TaxID=2749991 RepID=UPI003EE00327